MSSASLSIPALMTAEEYARRPDPGYPEELVRGRVVPMPLPNRRHGQICYRVARFFGDFVDRHDLGHILTNDAGVITERGPDTVRGADVAFYTYARLPKGPLAASYGPEVPDLVVEVVSPSDRWPKVLAKVAEYLGAGVTVVVVLDETPPTAEVFAPMDRRASSPATTCSRFPTSYRVSQRQFVRSSSDEKTRGRRKKGRSKSAFRAACRRIEDREALQLATFASQERPAKSCHRLWQERTGFDRNLFRQEAIVASLDDTHKNPVKWGLCGRATNWRWSSARFHLIDPSAQRDEALPRLHNVPYESLI